MDSISWHFIIFPSFYFCATSKVIIDRTRRSALICINFHIILQFTSSASVLRTARAHHITYGRYINAYTEYIAYIRCIIHKPARLTSASARPPPPAYRIHPLPLVIGRVRLPNLHLSTGILFRLTTIILLPTHPRTHILCTSKFSLPSFEFQSKLVLSRLLLRSCYS